MLKVEPKSDTPGIILSPADNIFEIYGKSLPEDASEFYQPVIDFMERYSAKPNPVTNFIINLEYYNSASVRQIISILTILEGMYKTGHNVTVKWLYEDNDEVMQENGAEFMETVDVPFELKSFIFDY